MLTFGGDMTWCYLCIVYTSYQCFTDRLEGVFKMRFIIQGVLTVLSYIGITSLLAHINEKVRPQVAVRTADEEISERDEPPVTAYLEKEK